MSTGGSVTRAARRWTRSGTCATTSGRGSSFSSASWCPRRAEAGDEGRERVSPGALLLPRRQEAAELDRGQPLAERVERPRGVAWAAVSERQTLDAVHEAGHRL